jgi:hypothetical protein
MVTDKRREVIKRYKNKIKNQIYYCECGSSTSELCKYKHFQTNKHLKFINLPEQQKEFIQLNYISLEVFAKKISI